MITKRPRLSVPIACALAVASCGDEAVTNSADREAPSPEEAATAVAAPLYRAEAQGGRPDHYIVKLKDELVPRAATAQRVEEILSDLPGTSVRRAWPNFRGFYGRIPANRLEAIRRHPLVAYVEKDEALYADGHRMQIKAEIGPLYGSGSQSSPEWHLDRIDEAGYPLDGTFAYDNSGDGVTIYVIDGGVLQTHDQFGTRADIVHEVDSWTPSDTDCYGHGTWVASAAAGEDWGVAKDATIEAIRINDCDNNANKGDAIDGMEWLSNNGTTPGVAVFSYSMDDDLFHSVSDAVEDVIAEGIAFVTSAGNNGSSSACGPNFHSSTSVLVVAALEPGSDTRASFSNYGSCVDLFAPGDSIKAADIDSDSDSAFVSGTSFAAPLAAGVAAMYLEEYTNDSPSLVHEAVKWGATPTNVSSGSPDRVLFANIPELHSVSWSGPTSVKTTDDCVWEADAVGGRQPYTYTWSGVLSGTGTTISGSVSSSGWLYLDVEDSTGAEESYQAYVSVGSTSGCPE